MMLRPPPNVQWLLLLIIAGLIIEQTHSELIVNARQDDANNSDLISFKLHSGKTVLERRMKENRRLESVLDVKVDKLYQGYGTHYFDLWIGTPVPQRQTVIVDTGSSLTAFPCSGCKNCGSDYHTDGYYDPEQSKTFRKVPCTECELGNCHGSNEDGYCSVHMSYAEGSSWSAYEATDWLYGGGSHTDGVTIPLGEDSGTPLEEPGSEVITQLKFGCQTALTGLFRTQLADGIMGMSAGKNTFLDQMYNAGKLKRKQFSLCFSRQDAVDRGGTDAGAMTLGGFDIRLHKTPIVFSKLLNSFSFYTVGLKAIYLRDGGGESARADSPDQKLVLLDAAGKDRSAIIDSGTTDTYLNKEFSQPFKAAWREMTGQEYTNGKVQLTKQQLKKLPTVVLQIGGVDKDFYGGDVDANTVIGLRGSRDATPQSTSPFDVFIAVPATHYMERDEKQKNMYTARIYLSERSNSLLGANAMMGHDVFFDLENDMVGFAESDCDYSTNIYDPSNSD